MPLVIYPVVSVTVGSLEDCLVYLRISACHSLANRQECLRVDGAS